MLLSRSARTGLLSSLLILVACLFSQGCGIEQLQPTLPNAVAGFTMADLEDIQDDDRLTDTEKKQQIREAVGAPDNDAGDRLVDFLFSLSVP